jgi:hypothetical protein
VPKEVLALIPLMKKGGEDATITRWLEIANAEASLKKRGDYALATVFANAVGRRELWQKRLEGITVIEAPIVKEWKDEARVETRIDSLIDLLHDRFSAIPQEVIDRIRASNDLALIRNWALKAATVATLDQFRQDTNL